MIIVIYFLLLLAASVEDYRRHTVRKPLVHMVWLLGLINMILEKENRWVTVALTCICFVFLLVFYILLRWIAQYQKKAWSFGGADVRLIPAMMLVQGWDVALAGVFSGFLMAVLYYQTLGRNKQELPLVPWMTAGCFLIEIIYLFSWKGML